MADSIPLHYAQSLLRLVPMTSEQLRQELIDLNMPLVLAEEKAVAEARIPVEEYGRLFIHLIHKLQQTLPSGGDPGKVAFSAYRMMFQAMLHARNLEQAMQRASIYFQRLGQDGETFHLEREGDAVLCRFEFTKTPSREVSSPENFNLDQLNWLPGQAGRVFSMGMWHRVCSWFIGSYIDLNAVEMTHSPNGNDYSEMFGMPVRFNAQRDAFSFNSRFLEFPIVQSEHSLDTMIATYPAELMRLTPGNQGVAGKVRQLIGSDFQRPLPSLQDVAERLFMTTPTLHRRLREEGTSFQQLKDLCRRDAAVGYLTSGDYTTAQLSELMGFSDSSTFHRAFKKWTGHTPQEYRAQHS